MATSHERLRCPLSVRGLNSPLVASCVGFSPASMTAAGSGPGADLAGTTCGHLELCETPRGFLPACTHARSTAVVPSARLVAATPRVNWPALEGLGVAAIVTDGAAVVAFWNPAAERLYGWSSDHAIGRSVLELTTDPESTSRASAILNELAAGFSWEGSWACRAQNGELVLVRLLDVPLCTFDGKPVGIAGFSVPLSEPDPDLRAIAQSLGLVARFRERAAAVGSDTRLASGG